jgi:hypothetical protein
MRYEKKVLVLSSVLAALLLIWGAGLLFSPERVAARSESAHLLAGKPADVASISLKSPGGTALDFQKSGADWVLVDGAAKLPAQAKRLSSFVDDIAAIARLRVVARSKDSWSGFQLDEAQAKHAILKDASGKTMADLYFGGYGPTGSESYIRKASSDLSYMADTGIASYFGSDRSSWLDLKVLGELKAEDIQSLSVKSSIALEKGKPALSLDYSLRREGKLWKSGAAQIDAEAVSSLLRSVANLRGEDYVAAPPPESFAKIDARLGLELGSGSSRVIEVGAPAGADRFYARVAGGSLVFAVSSYSLKSVLKSLAELAAKK